jgi:hypothetical protein
LRHTCLSVCLSVYLFVFTLQMYNNAAAAESDGEAVYCVAMQPACHTPYCGY